MNSFICAIGFMLSWAPYLTISFAIMLKLQDLGSYIWDKIPSKNVIVKETIIGFVIMGITLLVLILNVYVIYDISITFGNIYERM